MRDHPLRRSPQVKKPLTAQRFLNVCRIPCDSPPHLLSANFLEIDAKSAKTPKCSVLEKQLGYVPDLWSNDIKSFKWRQRSLVKLTTKDLGPQWTEDYFMYKCEDWRAGLKPNKHFAGTDVYGDAFVFKMAPNSYIMEPDYSAKKPNKRKAWPEYLDMRYSFTKEVEAKGEAFRMVYKLADK